nr:MAG TPA: hypothetical protein [Caudoviricetes sp.]
MKLGTHCGTYLIGFMTGQYLVMVRFIIINPLSVGCICLLKMANE